MTPARLAALVARAIGHAPTRDELEVWGDALACADRADQLPGGRFSAEGLRYEQICLQNEQHRP